MRRVIRFVTGLALALVFAGATVAALAITSVIVKDVLQSQGSIDVFESRIRHYSDRLDSNEAGLVLIRTPHPFVLHFGMLAFCCCVAVGSGMGLRRLQR